MRINNQDHIKKEKDSSKPSRLFDELWRKIREDPDHYPAMVDYKEEYLKSYLWKKIRRRILKRDSNKCRFCGGEATLVHHMSYEHEVLEGKADHMLVSLCPGCHKYLHFDDDGSMRTNEDVNNLLFNSAAPTELPPPIVDLRIKFPKPGIKHGTSIHK